MKLLFLVFTLTCFTLVADAQPTAFDIRQMIAESIEQLNVAPMNVNRVVNKEVSAGTHSISVRIYYPSDQEALPILYHIHGGAWIAGNLDTHDNICRRLALETNSIVVAIDYRRPPEYQFPTALEDCWFILNWINKNQEALKGDGRLFLIGDSAGGGLVPSLCIKNMSDDSPVKIDGQILINPATDLRPGSASYSQYKMFIDLYIAEEADKSNPLLSPLLFEDFKSLPKSIVVVSENDDIKNQGVLFHEQMMGSGNSSVIYEVKGMGHLGPIWAANSRQANPGVEFVVSQIKKWTTD